MSLVIVLQEHQGLRSRSVAKYRGTLAEPRLLLAFDDGVVFSAVGV
jgi:hypothetical protein